MKPMRYGPSLLAVAIALVSCPAVAQGPADGPANPALSVPLAAALEGPAKDAYDAAKLLVLNNDFAGALTKFQQAYDLSKDPRLISNMAVCEKNLRHYASAKTLLERYFRVAGGRMTPEERVSVSEAVDAIRNLVGSLKLTVAPAGTTLFVDGVAAGTSPFLLPVFVDLGKHVLTFKHPGFDPLEQAIEVPGGNTTDLAFALTASVHVATLTVATENDASVTIDGAAAGTGRYHDKVSAGPHTVRVTANGKQPFELELELHDGETRTLEVTLKDEKRLVWPWVLGGSVLVAAGLGVGAYFLFQPTTHVAAIPLGSLGEGSVQLKHGRLSR